MRLRRYYSLNIVRKWVNIRQSSGGGDIRAIYSLIFLNGSWGIFVYFIFLRNPYKKVRWR